MTPERNNLFPVFLKLESLDTLLVGAGNVGLEKLTALLKSSPEARITIVATRVHEEVRAIAERNPNITLCERAFIETDLDEKDLAILAANDRYLHGRIKARAKQKRILVNVADTPDLCDFYLGSVVTKGNIKIGISTNGQSPTIAKRLREFFEDIIPDDTDTLLRNMRAIRDRVKGDFAEKVRVLNEITKDFFKAG